MKSIAIVINTLFITVVSANKISCSKDAASAGSSLQNARKSLKKCKRSCPLSMIPSKREKCLSNLSKVSDKMKEVNEQVIAMSDDCAGAGFLSSCSTNIAELEKQIQSTVGEVKETIDTCPDSAASCTRAVTKTSSSIAKDINGLSKAIEECNPSTFEAKKIFTTYLR